MEEIILEIKDVSKNYKKKQALMNINFTIKKGERIGLIGANGSGKSTLSEIIAGIRKPSTGMVIKSEEIIIGIQFQSTQYPPNISCMDMIRYYNNTFKLQLSHEVISKLLQTYDLLGVAKKSINNLSGGQQQRLNILLSIIHHPDLVILDEVSTGLDIEVKEIIFAFLEENIIKSNRTMILVSHNMEEVERFCEKVIYLEKGQIIEIKMVKDIIAAEQSVFNYAKRMFGK